MYCPECGKKLNSKYRYCPNCLSKSLGIEDEQTKIDRINTKSSEYKNYKRNKKNGEYYHINFKNDNNKKKVNADPSNVNGYIVGEGMSIKGNKLRKGADSSRHALHQRWRYGY